MFDLQIQGNIRILHKKENNNILFSPCYILRHDGVEWEEHSVVPEYIVGGELLAWSPPRYIGIWWSG